MPYMHNYPEISVAKLHLLSYPSFTSKMKLLRLCPHKCCPLSFVVVGHCGHKLGFLPPKLFYGLISKNYGRTCLSFLGMQENCGRYWRYSIGLSLQLHHRAAHQPFAI